MTNAVIAVVLLLLFPVDVLAYLDPGTGSLIIQAIIGTLAVASLTIRMYWDRFKSLFRRAGEEKADDEDAAKPDEPSSP